MNPDNIHVPSALTKKASAARADSKLRCSPRAGALRWNWVVVILLLPLAGYGGYALTRDLLPKRRPVEASVDRPAATAVALPREPATIVPQAEPATIAPQAEPASVVPQPEPAREVKRRPVEIQARALPPSRALAVDPKLPHGAVVVMSFEESSFYEQDGSTYVRNASGQGSDALCQDVGFTAEGKCGGGLACQGGVLCLGRSLVDCQPNYTITLWCRCDDLTAGLNRVYKSFIPGRRNEPVFVIGYPPERNLHVDAWNRRRKPDWWKSAATEAFTIPESGWCFLAVTLENGATDTGTLTVTIDESRYRLDSQMVDTSDPKLADWVGGACGAVVDELTVYQRALSQPEIADIRSLGLQGVHFASGDD